MAELKCPHCGETRDSNIDYDWLAYHEQDCDLATTKARVIELESKLSSCEKERDRLIRVAAEHETRLDSLRAVASKVIEEAWKVSPSVTEQIPSLSALSFELHDKSADVLLSEIDNSSTVVEIGSKKSNG
jgi:uncharacterized coiled-coil protein SlyX